MIDIYELIIPPKLLVLALSWALGLQANWLYYCGIAKYLTQQTRDVVPMLGQCWASIIDGDPALAQHRDLENVYWQDSFSSNIVHSANASSMLGQHRRRWSTLKHNWVNVSFEYLVMYLFADINAVSLYSIGYCRPTRDRPTHALFAVEWIFKKKFVYDISGKKCLFLIRGKNMLCFLVGRKKIIWLGGKNIMAHVPCAGSKTWNMEPI